MANKKIITKDELNRILMEAPEGSSNAQIVKSLLAKGYMIDGIGTPGDKGEKGDTGEKGDKGDKGDKGERGIMGPPGEDGQDGQDGKDGKDGKNGKDGKDGKDGKNGETPTKEELEKIIKPLIPPPAPAFMGGGGFIETPIVAGSNITVTKNVFGNWVIASTASGGVGTPTSPTSGTVDGSTTAFDFATRPTLLVSDGATLRENFGWTWSGSTATLSVAPEFDLFSL